MIVILFEFSLLVILYLKLNRKDCIISAKQVLTIAIIQIIIFLLYRAELYSLGREVYYSDAENYWNYTIFLMDNFKENYTWINTEVGGQTFYIIFSYIIQKTSLFRSVIWNNISNILLINNSILLIGLMMKKNEVSTRKIKYFIFFNAVNPLIIYSLTRNLKDALTMFMTFLIIYLIIEGIEKKKKILLVLSLIVTILSSMLRPWNFLIFITTLMICIYFRQRKIKKNISAFIKTIFLYAVGFIAILLFLRKYSSTLNLWIPIIFDNAFVKNSFSFFSPIKILLGPGPVRSLLGADYFTYYTQVGNYCSFIGSILWWIIFSFFISKVIEDFLIKKKHRYNCFNISLLTITLLYLTIYSLQYGGSLELRFRGIMYIIVSATFFTIYEINNSENMKNIFVIVLPFIFIVGTILSL